MESQVALGILLSFTTLCSYLNYKFIRLPKSIGITLVALVITVIINIYSLFNLAVNDFAKLLVDSLGFKETLLNGMLSFLVFAASMHINTIELSKHKVMIACFSTISVLISTILIGFATFWITKVVGLNIPFYYCLVFGALISPTDAIPITSILESTKLAKSLEMKITGEALFNDGIGIALFFMSLGLAYGQQEAIKTSEVLIYFLREGGGGLLLGLSMGWVAARILKTIQDYELAITLTLALVSAGYIVATAIFGVSGPICMAVTGLIVGGSLKKGNISKDCTRRVEEFWDLLDALLNAILFVLIGLEFIRIDIEWQISLASAGAIIAILLARWISIFIPLICFTKFETFNSKVVTIMTWAGLRGGISIALALTITGNYRDNILTMTYFAVLWSIIVQGLTLKPMIQRLRVT